MQQPSDKSCCALLIGPSYWPFLFVPQGDLMGIYRPFIAPPGPQNNWHQPIFIEYGSATVTFYEPFETLQVSGIGLSLET